MTKPELRHRNGEAPKLIKTARTRKASSIPKLGIARMLKNTAILTNRSNREMSKRFLGFRRWTELPAVTLAPDEYYVIGDNRATSVLGPVSFDRVIGQVVF